jgi:hypothetical protein
VLSKRADCADNAASLPVLSGRVRFNFLSFQPSFRGDAQHRTRNDGEFYVRLPPVITRRASASAINTNADVTSGPPTRIRVGVFILFHS